MGAEPLGTVPGTREVSKPLHRIGVLVVAVVRGLLVPTALPPTGETVVRGLSGLRARGPSTEAVEAGASTPQQAPKWRGWGAPAEGLVLRWAMETEMQEQQTRAVVVPGRELKAEPVLRITPAGPGALEW